MLLDLLGYDGYATETVTVIDRSLVELVIPIYVTDDSTVRITVYLPMSEDLVIAEVATLDIALPAYVFDDVTVVEAVQVTMPTTAGLTMSVFDDITLTDAGTVLLPFLVPAVFENVAASEAVALSSVMPVVASEDVTIAEGTTLLIIGGTLEMGLADAVTITEFRSLTFNPAGQAARTPRRLLTMGVGA